MTRPAGPRRRERGHLVFLAVVAVAVVLARPVATWLGEPPDPGAAPWERCRVSAGERRLLAEEGDRPLSIAVDGTVARLSGTMTSAVVCKLGALHRAYPQVRMLVLGTMNGTIDEDSTMAAARLVRRWGLDTHAARNAAISSGGVTLYLAGNQRSAAPGAAFGVHSWIYTDNGVEGRDLPRSEPDHRIYLDFYRDLGVDPAYYWFTLDAAGADELHLMSGDEMTRFGFLTRARPRQAVLE